MAYDKLANLGPQYAKLALCPYSITQSRILAFILKIIGLKEKCLVIEF